MNKKASNKKLLDDLKAFIRTKGKEYLKDPNINSIGIGFKMKDGKHTDELSLQFTVDTKASGKSEGEKSDHIESLGSVEIPKTIRVEGVEVPTDVIQRKHQTSYIVSAVKQENKRKVRLDTIMPGISVGNVNAPGGGTLGAIVYGSGDDKPYILSNWHVLHTVNGNIGDTVVQPAPADDNRVLQNGCGKLVRSHLGDAGDCAIASIDKRGFDDVIMGLNAKVSRVALPELGESVVKSGRTTDVTYGIVRRIDAIVKLNYGGSVGIRQIGGFEIGPDPKRKAKNSQISMGGDSGSTWLIADKKGKATDVMVGLHFAGEGKGDPDDHAMACYAASVFKKLEISPAPENKAMIESIKAQASIGYDAGFLGHAVAPPSPSKKIAGDVVQLNNSFLIDYTHFSLCLSKKRRMAHFVAWNIDGGNIVKLPRKGLKFVFDDNVDKSYQLGNDVYVHNKLDCGHIARRADLCWGSDASKANKDSFYFTNITPQHEAFNQSAKHGLWGLLENAIFEDVDVENLKVSVMGGPIFKETDRVYRDVKIPSDFWKIIAYVDNDDKKLKAKAYVLSQDDLLNDIESLGLDEFKLWQVSIAKLEDIVPLQFGALKDIDAFKAPLAPESMGGKRIVKAREVASRSDLML